MNKQAVLAVALLSVTGYSYAEEQVAKDEAVQVTLEVRVNKDMVDEVVAEAKKDAEALEKKYEPVCGIDAVRTMVKRGVTEEEEVTRKCGCKCKCNKCTSGSCCKCKSVRTLKEVDEACTCEEQQGAEGTRAGCPACELIKQGNELKRQRQRERELQQQQQKKSVRSLKEDSEFCDCQIIHEKCEDCGNEKAEFRCNCGKPRPQGAEEVVRCNCRPRLPAQDTEQ